MDWILRFTLVLALLVSGCEGSKTRDIENYGDITQTTGGIALTTPAEHVGGWGRKDCLLCHNAALNLHRSPGSQIDVNKLNDLIKSNGESKYCLQCHGPNGVTQ